MRTKITIFTEQPGLDELSPGNTVVSGGFDSNDRRVCLAPTPIALDPPTGRSRIKAKETVNLGNGIDGALKKVSNGGHR
jgi:hypothetical protein